VISAFTLSLCYIGAGTDTRAVDMSKVTPPSTLRQSSCETTGRPHRCNRIPTKKKKFRGEFVAVPIPISSPALGAGLVPVVAYIFPLLKDDKVSPPSVVGAAGLITDNGSRAFAVAGQMFMKQDTYRATAVFFQGNLNYNLYGVGVLAGNAGLKIPLKQDGSVFLGEFVRQIKWKFFVGPRVLTGHSEVTLRPGGSTMVPVPPDIGLSTSLTSLGFTIRRDTRPNRFYATAGTFFEFNSYFFANEFGSKYSFESYRATFNKYASIGDRQVLAYNAYFCATGGQPPFYGNCIYGTNNELRGYEAGRYLDPYMVATQLEYRVVLPKRFGLVGFGGIGGMASSSRNLFRSDAFLPAGGAGLRFELSKTYHVNLRADLAAGKNEHTFSLGLGEAF
jgi:outer membrane protein assembly factor BamA